MKGVVTTTGQTGRKISEIDTQGGRVTEGAGATKVSWRRVGIRPRTGVRRRRDPQEIERVTVGVTTDGERREGATDSEGSRRNGPKRRMSRRGGID